MQSGKCCERASTLPAVGWRWLGAELASYVASGAVKERERCSRIGARRSSSSRRPRARDVNYC
jgi:hypothetical protein